ncbi:GDSL-like Lipase/Acylhydrolase family protein [Pedococcus dokdonensis]|uniref:GDSL-like Lipase/Acylhydrolase family protein n=1 Tax=Pedococcus dokdonensis TaxID=443156 RepID=A0A1H0TBH3_9MICO|nr:SGNH/GDSL hydrolase family protein [Pedococcus dokdonensis]SDP51413.1 GDSL-like Lipase/Acylhydrolase family protein [Pedococcus dokdonensis]
MAMTRTFGALVALGATAALTVSAAPAQAASSYVALGDSYSSGTGTRSYINDGTSCQRSVYAYPSLIAASKGLPLNFRACSGAKVADVTNTQLSALGAGTTQVSISVGGNDAGFADVLTECAQPGWMSDCNGAIDGAQNIVNNTLPSRLSTLYGSIRAKAPNAKVVVVGYPRIFMGEDCNAFTWFSPAEETRLNQMADLLNSKISAQASARGFSFVNPTSRFVGHAVCDDVEWLNGLSNPISESYHPNVAGHRDGYAPLVSTPLTGSALRVSASTLRQAERSAARLATQQRRYAGADASISPEQFRAPDLTTPAARAAAKRAGVDLSSRASIDAADRAWSQRQATAYRATH